MRAEIKARLAEAGLKVSPSPSQAPAEPAKPPESNWREEYFNLVEIANGLEAQVESLREQAAEMARELAELRRNRRVPSVRAWRASGSPIADERGEVIEDGKE